MLKTSKKIKIMAVSELAEKIGKTVVIDHNEIALFRLSNGEIRAIENRCPHKGGVLAEGLVSGKFVFCPLHDWKISVENGKVQAPDHGCVRTFKTEVKNGYIYLLIE